jgi:hypothetical protein
VNFLPDTFVRTASPNPVVFSERFAFKPVSASAESEADPLKMYVDKLAHTTIA